MVEVVETIKVVHELPRRQLPLYQEAYQAQILENL